MRLFSKLVVSYMCSFTSFPLFFSMVGVIINLGSAYEWIMNNSGRIEEEREREERSCQESTRD